MRTWRSFLGNERGVALPLAMILLMVLTLLTITFMSLGAVEPQISRNLSDGARARQLAESGLEWGITQLRAQDFTTLLSSATTGASCGPSVTCRVLGTAQTLPGLTSSAGTFTVTLRNDYLANDTLLTGLANETQSTADGSGAGSVPNGIVILSSTGTFNGASRTITAVVQRGNLPVNAALTLPGVQTDTYTNAPPCSGCYSVDGRNWSLSDTSTPTGSPSAPKLGIATYTGSEGSYTYEQNAEHGFQNESPPGTWVTDSSKAGYVQGNNQTSPGNVTTGLNTIASDTTLNPAIVSNFLKNLAANPTTQILNSTQACEYPSGGSAKPEGLQMASTGTANHVTVTNNCTGTDQVNQTVNLGTSASPALLYVKGEYDPTSNFIGMSVSGNQPITGYGILVMEDADLSFFQSGQFTWNGIVVVTGRNVGVGFRGGSNTEIRGALIANETNG
ncbi:MAG TPA: PilX N-terminal domain-containing pilus assembly protein, partial [Methylomirabilota bacterium]